MEKELNKFRANLKKEQMASIEQLLYVLQQEYFALEPLEAINGSGMPLRIRSAQNIDLHTSTDIARRIVQAREAIENIAESLSWEGDSLIPPRPVTVQIVDQININNTDVVIKYDPKLGNIQIGIDALSLPENMFALRFQMAFRQAFIHMEAQALGKILGTNSETQELLEEKMNLLVGRGESFSELILFVQYERPVKF